jgi:hypothetical protein
MPNAAAGTDQRSAPHLHVADGGGGTGKAVQAQIVFFVGQAGLVEDDDLVAVPAQGRADVGHGITSMA